jgi:hypothetical protein
MEVGMDDTVTDAAGATDAPEDLVSEASEGSGIGTSGLLAALEEADDLPLDERLALLRSAEERIADALEGLDGL